jgi:hypothetical protein
MYVIIMHERIKYVYIRVGCKYQVCKLQVIIFNLLSVPNNESKSYAWDVITWTLNVIAESKNIL